MKNKDYYDQLRAIDRHAAADLAFTRRVGAAIDRCDAAGLPLSSALDVRREQAKIYREVKAGLLNEKLAAKLVWILGELRQSLCAEELEARISTLERDIVEIRKDKK